MREDAEFFVAEAARSWRLAQGSNDWRLLHLGCEFTERALRLGADPDDLPEEWRYRRPCSTCHSMDCDFAIS